MLHLAVKKSGNAAIPQCRIVSSLSVDEMAKSMLTLASSTLLLLVDSAQLRGAALFFAPNALPSAA
jgi:hypothetical protein